MKKNKILKIEQLNKVLKIMYDNKIIHRDIKPENVLIKKQKIINIYIN